MYRDKDKQREANRKAQAKFKAKGITKQGITSEGITDKVLLNKGVTQGVTITKADSHVDVSDISVVKALHQTLRRERTAQGNIRVSKPGDADYVPQCETTRAFVENRPKRIIK